MPRNPAQRCSLEFFPGRFAPFSDQLVNQRYAGFYILSHQPLRSSDPVFQRGDPQFVVFESQYDFVPRIDAQRLAKRSGDDEAAIFVHAGSGFGFHCHNIAYMTKYGQCCHLMKDMTETCKMRGGRARTPVTPPSLLGRDLAEGTQCFNPSACSVTSSGVFGPSLGPLTTPKPWPLSRAP